MNHPVQIKLMSRKDKKVGAASLTDSKADTANTPSSSEQSMDLYFILAGGGLIALVATYLFIPKQRRAAGAQ